MDSDQELFLTHVRKLNNGCWEWTGAVAKSNGYSRAYIPSRKHRGSGHRIAYELFIGPVPAGYHVDHTCHNQDESCYGRGADCPHRRCVNPDHLEAVTPSVNRIRSTAARARRDKVSSLTHCPRGHELTPENRFSLSRCKECDRNNRSRARQKRLGYVGAERCGVVSPKGNPCQRDKGHEGRHHGEQRRYRAEATL